MLKERQKAILEAVVREHIRTAHPVASQELSERYRFDVSPATIRNEMVALDELGYIEQPHTSAGRIPTDRGYRLFVDELIDTEQLLQREQESLDSLFRKQEETFLNLSARMLARLTRAFAVTAIPKERTFYKTGFSEVLAEPEFVDADAMRHFGEFVDSLDEEMKPLLDEDDFVEPRTFIGEENPINEARRYSMIVSSVVSPDGEENIVALVGPKRMNYRKNISLVNYLTRHGRKK